MNQKRRPGQGGAPGIGNSIKQAQITSPEVAPQDPPTPESILASLYTGSQKSLIMLPRLDITDLDHETLAVLRLLGAPEQSFVQTAAASLAADCVVAIIFATD